LYAYASRVIFEEEPRGGFFDPALIGYSGLELMRLFLGAIREGKGTPPPIHHLTGVIPTEAGPGMSTFRMPASGWLATPAGVFLGATIGIPADSALGTAIQTTLPPATAYTTQELTLNYLRPASTDNEVLVARGRLVHLGRSLGLSEVIVEDANGRTLGHGSSRCFIFEPIRPAPEPPESYEFPDLPTYEIPDPYLRPVEGEIWPDEVWKEMSGLEIYKAAVAGELGPPPISQLTGLRPVDAGDGFTEWVMPATAWLCSPLGTVQGGMIGLLADNAIGTAIQTILPAGTAYASLDLKVNFLRPATPDGRDLTARGTVTHRGKTIAVADGEITNTAGKRVAVARGSAVILPGWPQSLSDPRRMVAE
jgi:uncharacterized protein (TIGR00369 family)